MQRAGNHSAVPTSPTHWLEGDQASAWLERSDRGSDDWWEAIANRGTPIVEWAPGGPAKVTFLWRCPAWLVPSRVYASVTSVTNHHQQDPQSLSNLHGTDIWYWQTCLPADWRGSYAFIPTQGDALPPTLDPAGDPRQLKHRAWWRDRLHATLPDPNNPLRPYRGVFGAWFSPLHLPEAPDQSAWAPFDADHSAPVAAQQPAIEWISARLGTRRKVWLFHTENADLPSDDLPLALLLDGQKWAETMPIAAILQEELAEGSLPPAAYVLVDALDSSDRQRDLGCSLDFWEAVQDELLPLIEARLNVTRDPARTVVAGQSLGGLAATYAALTWPARFGGAISSSGSFWWPDVETIYASTNAGGQRDPHARVWLAEDVLRQDYGRREPQHFFLEVGSREGVMVDVNETMAAALRAAGHQVTFRIYEGGHDTLCWRGGLIDGLRVLLGKPQIQNEKGPEK